MALVLGLIVVVTLGVTVVVGTSLGRRWSVAPPVLLILLGGGLGLIPGLQDVVLEPEVVLLLFLPPILYWESINTSLREIRANLRVIVLYSVFLVIATAVAVSYAAQALGVDERAAWVLGAVLAPTDAAAMAGLARALPRRTLTTLRAESLINDGTALVLFAIAVGVAEGTTDATPLGLGGQFVGAYAGGVLAGLLGSLAVVLARKRFADEPLRDSALSVLTPFVAFLLAEVVHASGVVAVVTAGLVLTHVGPRLIAARSRVESYAFWDVATFLVNGALFTLVGLQLPGAVRGLDGSSLSHALLVALAVTGVVIGTRLAWVHVVTVVIRTVDRREAQRARRVGWRARTASGWAGFRGAVSLATALAVPEVLPGGEEFPDRDLLIFVTGVVILVTILLQGSTLPAVMRWARLPEDTARAEELREARRAANEAGLAALDEAAARHGVTGERLERIREAYRQDAAAALEEDEETVAQLDGERALRLDLLARKRDAVTRLRDRNRIDDIVLREIQATLDLEEIRLLGPAPAD